MTTTNPIDLSVIDATKRPAPRIPLAAVQVVRFQRPWIAGERDDRAWCAAVEERLAHAYCGESFATVIDSGDSAICLDLDAGDQGWRALYPAARPAGPLISGLQRAADEITAAAAVRPLLIEVVPVSPGPCPRPSCRTPPCAPRNQHPGPGVGLANQPARGPARQRDLCNTCTR